MSKPPRRMESVEARLAQMSGEGRLILTASSANEPAWENPRTGHGYFTHFLLEALQGPEAVVEAKRLPVLALFQYVTRRVIDARTSLVIRSIQRCEEPSMEK
jgi:helicase